MPTLHRIYVTCVFGLTTCLLVTANAISSSTVSASDWPQFRGTNSAGLALDQSIVSEFGPGKNELWSLDVGAGHSSPIITGESLFLTTFNAEERELGVVCIDRQLGETRWVRTLQVDEIETGHPSFNPASSTPCTDGSRVVAYFGSYGLICYDLDGEMLWDYRLPVPKSYAGNATSPAIVDDKVILYRGNHVDHFLMALDKRTGQLSWKVDQEEPFNSELACTACPIVYGDKIVVHTARSVQCYDPNDGRLVWVSKCATTATSTPVIADGEVLVAAWNKMGEPALRPDFPSYDDLLNDHDQDQSGSITKEEYPRLMIFHRPDGAEAPQNGASLRFQNADKNRDGVLERSEWERQLKEIEDFRALYEKHGLLAVRLDSDGLVGEDDVRVLERKGIPEVPSPLYHDGLVYLVKNGGVMTVLDVSSGKRVAKVRTQGLGTHYASPIMTKDQLVSTAGDGTISILTTGSRPEVVVVNKMDEKTYATPAISDGILYVRTHSRLYAFGKSLDADEAP